MFLIPKEYIFPPVTLAQRNGILAVGGDLHPERMLLAYRNGIFPWYNEGEPIIWYAPPKRMVLKPEEVYISKSMSKILKENIFSFTFNQYFETVIHNCQNIFRSGQDGTWITEDYKKSLLKLHQMGYAQSVEVWKDDQLVGGLYGINLGKIFTGESMFSTIPNASKAGFIYLCHKLQSENYNLLDCQVYNEHLASLGAYEIPRKNFMKFLKGEI